MDQAGYHALVNFLEIPQPMLDVSLTEEKIAIGSTIGSVRKENQDRHLVATYSHPAPARCFCAIAIADGVGSLAESGWAASACLSAFITSLISQVDNISNDSLPKWQTFLASAVQEANDTVFGATSERGASTLSAVVQTPQGIFAVHVGDSQIFGSDGSSRLIKITADQTVASHLKALGVPSAEAVGRDLRFDRSLAQYVGMADALLPDVFTIQPNWKTLVACSDGIAPILKVLNDTGWQLLCQNSKSEVDLAKKTLHLANWIGGGDNCTVAIWKPSEVLLPQSNFPTLASLFVASGSRRSELLRVLGTFSRPDFSGGKRPIKTSRQKTPTRSRPGQKRKTETSRENPKAPPPPVTFLPGLDKEENDDPGTL